MSWEATESATNASGGLFHKLQDGDNVLRICSEPEIRRVHWEDGKGLECLGENCQYCNDGPPKVRFKFVVLERKTNTFQLAEFGPSIVNQLRELQKEGEYAFTGPVCPYDVTIKRKGSGLDTEYTVIPARENKELTEEESKSLVEFVERFGN